MPSQRPTDIVVRLELDQVRTCNFAGTSQPVSSDDWARV